MRGARPRPTCENRPATTPNPRHARTRAPHAVAGARATITTTRCWYPPGRPRAHARPLDLGTQACPGCCVRTGRRVGSASAGTGTSTSHTARQQPPPWPPCCNRPAAAPPPDLPAGGEEAGWLAGRPATTTSASLRHLARGPCGSLAQPPGTRGPPAWGRRGKRLGPRGLPVEARAPGRRLRSS